MTDQRIIIQMGSGHQVAAGTSDSDLADATQVAATLALGNALERADLSLAKTLGLADGTLRRVATLAVPAPERLDMGFWNSMIPDLFDSLKIVAGGQFLDRSPPENPIIVATLSFEVFAPAQTGWRIEGD